MRELQWRGSALVTTPPTVSALVYNPAAVRKAAAAIGCVQTRGRGTGTAGSLSRLLNEIAAGEVLLMFHPFDGPGEMTFQAQRIRELAETLSGLDPRQELLRGLAGALESAAELKRDNIALENEELDS